MDAGENINELQIIINITPITVQVEAKYGVRIQLPNFLGVSFTSEPVKVATPLTKPPIIPVISTTSNGEFSESISAIRDERMAPLA